MGLFSALNAGIAEILKDTDFQNLCKFESIVLGDVFGDPFQAAADLFIGKFYLQSIDIPDSKFLYQPVNGEKVAKGIEYPESINIKYIETQEGLVIRYLEAWKAQVAEQVPIQHPTLEESFGPGLSAIVSDLFGSTDGKNRAWNDDQNLGKKTIFVWPQPSDGGFPFQPRRILKGVRPIEIGQQTWSQGNKEILIYDVTCSIDDVEIPALI